VRAGTTSSRKGFSGAERLVASDVRDLLVTPLAQLDHDQFRLVDIRHDDPVRLDAEALVPPI
jgi:hypothetical protein